MIVQVKINKLRRRKTSILPSMRKNSWLKSLKTVHYTVYRKMNQIRSGDILKKNKITIISGCQLILIVY